jgi:hypothetical protein
MGYIYAAIVLVGAAIIVIPTTIGVQVRLAQRRRARCA